MEKVILFFRHLNLFLSMQKKNVSTKVLVAPLNWGWGHASRCVPVIKTIQEMGLTPVIASDGDALMFLQKEFPGIETLELPSYHIKYGSSFKWSMFLNIPSILKGIYKEHQAIKEYIHLYKTSLLGIISDNRLGVFSKDVDSVYITHQLNIKAGMLSFLVNNFHHFFIKKHKECWVPDEVGSMFSGELSMSKKIKSTYIGMLSRLNKREIPTVYNVMILLSGIENQRNQLELTIASELSNYKGNVLLVRGTFKPCDCKYPENITVVDYMLTEELEKAINQSETIVVRSGYSSVMDMAVLEKKVLYIPTPGQTEQEYLAKYLEAQNLGKSCAQKSFSIKNIEQTKKLDPISVRSSSQKLRNHLERCFNSSQV